MKKQKEKQQKKQHDQNRGKENNCFYPSEKEAKEAILDIGQRMYVRNFVAANDGNISIRTGENEVWATPTGVSKGFMNKKMLVKVDLQGNVLEGTHKPSSELKMHLRAYQENPDLRSVCHAPADLHKLFHSGNSTGCSGSGRGRDYVGGCSDCTLCGAWYEGSGRGDSTVLSYP